MKEELEKLLEDMGIDTFINEGNIPSWLIELAEKIINAGWKKD